MKLLLTSLLLSFFLLLQSCSQGNKCNGVCSEEFRTITVNIVDSEGDPVALDSFKVTNLENGRDLTREVNEMEFQQMRETGTYPLFGDEFFREFREQKLKINFTGFKNGGEVVSADYMVGTDCCHVYHIAGDLNLEL